MWAGQSRLCSVLLDSNYCHRKWVSCHIGTHITFHAHFTRPTPVLSARFLPFSLFVSSDSQFLSELTTFGGKICHDQNGFILNFLPILTVQSPLLGIKSHRHPKQITAYFHVFFRLKCSRQTKKISPNLDQWVVYEIYKSSQNMINVN